jgi:hypothetical protein
MPGMTGSRLAKVIKAEWPGLAILIATELPDGLGRDIPELAKPCFQEDLANAIAGLRRFSTRPSSAARHFPDRKTCHFAKVSWSEHLRAGFPPSSNYHFYCPSRRQPSPAFLFW